MYVLLAAVWEDRELFGPVENHPSLYCQITPPPPAMISDPLPPLTLLKTAEEESLELSSNLLDDMSVFRTINGLICFTLTIKKRDIWVLMVGLMAQVRVRNFRLVESTVWSLSGYCS